MEPSARTDLEARAATDLAGLPDDPDLARILADVSARRGLRLSALVGAVASALWLVAYFLPWIVIPGPQRELVRAKLEPEIAGLARRSPQDAERYRVLLRQVTDEGTLAGLDLFHYARSAHALNQTYQRESTSERAPERSRVVQRTFHAASWLLAALPIASLLLVLGLVLGRLRRAGAVPLTALVLVGCTGCAMALGWLRVADTLYTDMLWGSGLKLGLVASVSQACAGLFGVTSRNWWRVYVTALLALGAATLGVLAYVSGGWHP